MSFANVIRFERGWLACHHERTEFEVATASHCTMPMKEALPLQFFGGRLLAVVKTNRPAMKTKVRLPSTLILQLFVRCHRSRCQVGMPSKLRKSHPDLVSRVMPL